jgi:hypothetical protein
MVQIQKMWNRGFFYTYVRERIARIQKVWNRVQFSLQTQEISILSDLNKLKDARNRERWLSALSHGLNGDEVNRFRWSLMVHTIGLIFVWWVLCMLPLVISKH